MSYKNRYYDSVLRSARVGLGFTLPGAIHTSGIYPSSRLSESYVGQCWTPDQGGVYRVAGSGYGQVRGAKWQSSDSSFIAPDTYPTRSVRTRLGTARVPTGTSVGMVSSPAFTNKVTCRKTNPTDTTNLMKGGDAASVLSVVLGTAADFQDCIDIVGNVVDMSAICSSYKYYRLDNSVGSTEAYVVLLGPGTPNVVMHTARVFIKGGSGTFGQTSTYGGRLSFTPQVVFRQLVDTKMPAGTGSGMFISANPGQRVDFILPEFVESSYLPADPIVPLTAAADTLASFTRAAVYMEEDTAGVFPTVSVVETLEIGHPDNPYATQATRMSDGSVVPVVAGASWAQNFAVFGTCVPDAAIPFGLHILTSFLTVDNYFSAAYFFPTTINSAKRIAATSYIISANYTHAANAPFDYLTIQTIHGMAIRVRPHATMTWSAWATNVTVNGKKPAPLATKYQIGAVLGTGGIAGKHPKVSIFELGNQASLAAYQDRAMILIGRIV